MIDQNDNQPLDLFARKWLLVVILCLVPPFFLFALLGDPGRGRAAAICVGVSMTAIRACWNLRKHRWFWMVFVVVITLQALLVVFVPWSAKSYPGYALLPVAVLDYVIVYGFFKLVEKVMVRAMRT